MRHLKRACGVGRAAIREPSHRPGGSHRNNVFTQRFKILSQSAIASVGQKLAFIEGVQTLDTIEAYTAKADQARWQRNH